MAYLSKRQQNRKTRRVRKHRGKKSLHRRTKTKTSPWFLRGGITEEEKEAAIRAIEEANEIIKKEEANEIIKKEEAEIRRIEYHHNIIREDPQMDEDTIKFSRETADELIERPQRSIQIQQARIDRLQKRLNK
jgi:ribosomal protein S20